MIHKLTRNFYNQQIASQVTELYSKASQAVAVEVLWFR